MVVCGSAGWCPARALTRSCIATLSSCLQRLVLASIAIHASACGKKQSDKVVLFKECKNVDPFDLPDNIQKDFRTNDRAQCALPQVGGTCSAIAPGPLRNSGGTSFTALTFLSGAITDGLCTDILADDTIQRALERVVDKYPNETVDDYAQRWASLSKDQRGAALLIDRVEPVQCTSEAAPPSPTKWAKVHGAFDPKTWRIIIYRSALDAHSIYFDDVTRYNVGFRYALIMFHELGHALDAMTGDLLDDRQCRDREQRATLYGTYFAECFSRILRMAAHDWEHDNFARQCHEQNYTIYQYYYLQLRLALGKEIANHTNALSSQVEGSIGCYGL